MTDLPHAVWSGEIMGMKVHVLSDGARIIEADSLERFLNGDLVIDDPVAFAVSFTRWKNGGEP